ncbi:unnamed protein product [Closterium sp. NIES-53]
MVHFMVLEQQRCRKLVPKARSGLHLGVSPKSKAWEDLDLTDNTSVTVAFADPSAGPVEAHSTTSLPCPAAPSRFLTGYYTPSFSRNLGVRLTSQDTHLTPQTSPPQRPVPVVSQGAGGAVEGEGTGAAGAGGAGSRGAGGVGVEATPVEDTATSSQRSHLASPPGFPSVLACLCGWLLRSLGVCLREVLEQEMAEEDPRLQQQVRLQPQQERLEEEPLPQQQGQVLYVRGNDTCG